MKKQIELATRHSDNEVINISQTEHIAFDEGFKQGKLVQKQYDENMSIEEIDYQISCCDERIEYLMELKFKKGGME